jgi:hypothetical protein
MDSCEALNRYGGQAINHAVAYTDSEEEDGEDSVGQLGDDDNDNDDDDDDDDEDGDDGFQFEDPEAQQQYRYATAHASVSRQRRRRLHGQGGADAQNSEVQNILFGNGDDEGSASDDDGDGEGDQGDNGQSWCEGGRCDGNVVRAHRRAFVGHCNQREWAAFKFDLVPNSCFGRESLIGHTSSPSLYCAYCTIFDRCMPGCFIQTHSRTGTVKDVAFLGSNSSVVARCDYENEWVPQCAPQLLLPANATSQCALALL